MARMALAESPQATARMPCRLGSTAFTRSAAGMTRPGGCDAYMACGSLVRPSCCTAPSASSVKPLAGNVTHKAWSPGYLGPLG
jgi:hypothetical protein